MGSKVEKHLSRLAMPVTWHINRKTNKWITRPLPGAHSFKLGMPLVVILRDMIKVGKTSKEIKSILNSGEVQVDGKKIKELKLIVGLMDTISMPKIKKYYRILLNKKGRLFSEEISDKESLLKLCRINKKTCIQNKKIQLNLHDGKNIIVEKDQYKVGDSVLIGLPKKDIKDTVRLEKGCTIYLIGGKHTGELGSLEEIKGKEIIYKKGDIQSKTLKKYAFAVGKEKPVISIK